MDPEIRGVLFQGRTVAAVSGHAHDIVAELTSVGLGGDDILISYGSALLGQTPCGRRPAGEHSDILDLESYWKIVPLSVGSRDSRSLLGCRAARLPAGSQILPTRCPLPTVNLKPPLCQSHQMRVARNRGQGMSHPNGGHGADCNHDRLMSQFLW